MDVVTLSLAMTLGLLGGEEKQASPPCAWSSVWPQLTKGKYAAAPSGATIEPPSRKGGIKRPHSEVKHKVKGDWKVELAIDHTGKIRDVRIVERPRIEPEWPEYEAHVLATLKEWRYTPAKVDGQPWPNCMTVTLKD